MSFLATQPTVGHNNGQAQRQSRSLPLTAISKVGPKPLDLIKTKELEEFLFTHDFRESDEEEPNLRMQVLKKMNELAKKWIKEGEGKIHTFLSYRLGAYGDDLDALCVAPHQMEQTNYFIASFVDLLKQQPEVTELCIVEEAFFCVLKIYFDGIELDVLFSRLAPMVLEEILENDLKGDMLLRTLDQKFALNRVTDEVLRLVPNIDNFRTALRVIKFWAKKHSIYSNVLGYLDGVSLTVLVARTCQLYPNAAAATLVQKFFLVFSKWEWPEPVLLLNPPPIIPVVGFPSPWDPRFNVEDRFHLMPILTPAHPQQNSARNVMSSTQTIMQEEFQNSRGIAEKIMRGKSTWDKLFETPNFFNKYKQFVVVIASSYSAEDHLEWVGLVESEIWHLILVLESNDRMKKVHINPQKFDPVQPEPDTFSIMWFIGIVIQKKKNINIDLTQEILGFSERVARFKTEKECRRIDVKHVKRKELSTYLPSSFIQRKKRLNSTDDVNLNNPSTSKTPAIE